MRVLHVITGLNAGGAEQWLWTLVGNSRHDNEVLALSEPGVLAEALCRTGVRVSCAGMRGNRDVLAAVGLVGRIRARRPDVVHTHLFRAQLYGALAARLAGVRTVVSTEHSLNRTRIEGRPTTRPGVRLLYRVGAACTDRTVAVSRPVADLLADGWTRADRTVVVPLGIDRQTFVFDPAARRRVRDRLGVPPDVPLVGGVGRLVPGKRFEVLLDAVAHLPGAHVVVAGAGPERDRLLRRAAHLGIAHRVHLPGEVAEPAPLLCAMDAFASPSAEETFGMAVLEALASGLPAVYVRCPALEGGPPVPGAVHVGPGTDELTAALRAALLRGPWARRPPPGLDRFDPAVAARTIDDFYDELVRGGGRGHGVRTGRGTRSNR
ncbi:hypothetical protein AD006_11730 [Pseudonocardia sp. EC080610-09]|uniref:glycosyltransferase n=1 Tax=Pseudonocardia sp. EC080610-09 TaxID=1688404 RepID=UPI0007065E36|nr:glycosyltransferase [Pseudonocardia sp. EC080610-09]ALL75805.1 hypothetical protein AD006_11730 [Pseudonocardia sp. EC080610-09]